MSLWKGNKSFCSCSLVGGISCVRVVNYYFAFCGRESIIFNVCSELLARRRLKRSKTIPYRSTSLYSTIGECQKCVEWLAISHGLHIVIIVHLQGKVKQGEEERFVVTMFINVVCRVAWANQNSLSSRSIEWTINGKKNVCLLFIGLNWCNCWFGGQRRRLQHCYLSDWGFILTHPRLLLVDLILLFIAAVSGLLLLFGCILIGMEINTENWSTRVRHSVKYWIIDKNWPWSTFCDSVQ